MDLPCTACENSFLCGFQAASALAINVADTEAEQKEKAELQAARLIPYGVDVSICC